MSKSKPERAMGCHDGDYLELHNQWAKVCITRHCGDNGPLAFEVSGDLADVREATKTFPTAYEAVTYAMYSLEEYERGALR